MLTFTATLTVKAGQEQAFERIMRIAVPKVREEPGNHAYLVHRSTQDARVFMVYEAYEDEEALDAHRAHLRDMGLDVQTMLEGAPVVAFYDRLV